MAGILASWAYATLLAPGQSSEDSPGQLMQATVLAGMCAALAVGTGL